MKLKYYNISIVYKQRNNKEITMPLNAQTCQERKQRIAEQNRAAVKRFYTNPENKKKKMEAQRKRRAKQKAICEEALCNEMNQCSINDYNNDNNDIIYDEPQFHEPPDYIEDENVVVAEEPQVDITNPENMLFTEKEILALLKNDRTIGSENTRETYMVDIKRVFEVTKCANFKSCLNTYKKMVTSIINSKKPIKKKKENKTKKNKQPEPEPEPEAYAVNTIKQTLQSILFVGTQYMDDFKILFNNTKASQIKKYLNTQFEKYKELSRLEIEERQQNTEYPTFDEYLNKVIEKYSKNSKEYLIAYLYSQFTVRDNFKSMLILDSIRDDNKKDNFLLISRNKMMFIVNDFKTKKKFERLEFTVTDAKLKKMIKDFINDPKHITNRKKNGNYFIGKSSLSPSISKINKSLGYDNMGGINIYRHMRVTDVHKKKDITFEERKKLSDEMGHGLTVQSQYRRNLKVSERRF